MGIVHVRGKPPSEGDKNSLGNILLAKSLVDNHISHFNGRLASLLKNIPIDEKELEKLGKKDPQKAVDNFIASNCVEVAKEKWLCPLSGKKFKGPEFIHKHLQSKYQDNIDEVRNEAIYFNNFVMDPSHPHDYEPKPQTQNSTPTSFPPSLPAHPNPTLNQPRSLPPATDEVRIVNDYPEKVYRQQNWGNNLSGDRYMGRPPRFGGRGGFNTGRELNRPQFFDPMNERRDPRQPITYRDLDAPEEIF